MDPKPISATAPCPFCGGEDVELHPFPWVGVRCRTCGAEGPEISLALFSIQLEDQAAALTQCLEPAAVTMWETRFDRSWGAGGALSCPFCGSGDVMMESDWDEVNHGWRFGCTACGARGPWMWHPRSADARKAGQQAWNGKFNEG